MSTDVRRRDKEKEADSVPSLQHRDMYIYFFKEVYAYKTIARNELMIIQMGSVFELVFFLFFCCRYQNFANVG